jgi:hypothetical protein
LKQGAAVGSLLGLVREAHRGRAGCASAVRRGRCRLRGSVNQSDRRIDRLESRP